MTRRIVSSMAYTTALASFGLIWMLITTSFSSTTTTSVTVTASFLPCLNGHRRRHGAPLEIGGLGWDNDNFLNSLSGGKEALDKANEAYYRRSRFGRENKDGVVSSGGRSMSSSSSSFSSGDEEDDDDIDLSSPGALGAALTPEMIARAKASHTPEEEASQGGSMFREMMARAKAGEFNRPRSPPPPPVVANLTPPPPPPPFPVPTAPFASTTAADPSSLSVEEQAALFRQMMMMQNQQQQPAVPAAAATYYYQPQPQPPPPPARGNYLEGGIGPDGRKIGRNRDADAINNSADVYFAQLKRDSTVRNILRRSGREDEANLVFVDPSIQEIKLHVNPHMEEIKRKERELLETSRDEQIIQPEMLWQKDRRINHPESYSGISYKEKMKQKQLAKQQESSQQQQQAQPPQPAASAAAATIAAPPEPPAVSKPEPTTITAAVYAPPAPAAVVPPAPPAAVPPPAPLQQQRQAPMAAAATSTTTNTPAVGSDGEDGMRRDIRQLMGLLLKHRGGPGFGSGRLQEAEAQRMETLALEMTQILRQEAANAPPRTSPHAQQQTTFAAAAPPPPLFSTPGAAPPVTTEKTTTASTAATRYSPNDGSITANAAERIQSMLSCMDGAITMYRNAPMELQEGILITLRSAILSAVITCNDIILEPPPVAIPPLQYPQQQQQQQSSWGTSGASGGGGGAIVQAQQTPTGDRINSMLSCIQGAITMYRNSPMELQETILVTLRSALLSAVNTCNEIIAKNEMQNYEAFRRVATDPRTRDSSRPPSSTLPTQFYDVIPQEQQQSQQQWQEVTAPPSTTATPAQPQQQQVVVATVASSATTVEATTLAIDSNSQVLENIYDKLQAAAGDGKMGLRPDLTPEETAELADAIADMRMLLVDELENGIPAAAASSSSSSSATSTTATTPAESYSSTSKYQQMLAKARAEKEGKQ